MMCVKAPRSQYVWLVSCPQVHSYILGIFGPFRALRNCWGYLSDGRCICVQPVSPTCLACQIAWSLGWILLGIQTSHSSAPVHTGSCLAGKGWEGSRIRESPKCLNIGSCMILSILVHLQIHTHIVYMIRVIYIYIQYILYIHDIYIYIIIHIYNIISYIIIIGPNWSKWQGP